MNVGDMVRHKYGTIAGHGMIIKITRIVYDPDDNHGRVIPHEATLLWNGPGGSMIQNCMMQWMEVINESR